MCAAATSQTDIMAVSIKKIGVIGAGQMGAGIAHVCALAGFHVAARGLTQFWSLLSTAPGNRGAAHFIWGLPPPD